MSSLRDYNHAITMRGYNHASPLEEDVIYPMEIKCGDAICYLPNGKRIVAMRFAIFPMGKELRRCDLLFSQWEKNCGDAIYRVVWAK